MDPATTTPEASLLDAVLSAGDAHAWNVQTTLPATTILFYVLTGVFNGTPVRIFIGGNGAATTADDVTTYSGTAIDDTGLAEFVVSSLTSSLWAAGKYGWLLLAIDVDGNRTQLAQGCLTITPDVAGATPVDPRTKNEQLLDAIKALLQGRALDDSVMYKVGGRELTKLSPIDLERWQGIVAARVRNARLRREGRSPYKKIGITFGGHR